jgi:hypothetical protein
MQALGAYGFLSEVRGKDEFLNFIPAAKDRLVVISESPGGVKVLAEALRG